MTLLISHLTLIILHKQGDSEKTNKEKPGQLHQRAAEVMCPGLTDKPLQALPATPEYTEVHQKWLLLHVSPSHAIFRKRNLKGPNSSKAHLSFLLKSPFITSFSHEQKSVEKNSMEATTQRKRSREAKKAVNRESTIKAGLICSQRSRGCHLKHRLQAWEPRWKE